MPKKSVQKSEEAHPVAVLLRRAREAKGWSLARLSEESGIPRNSLHHYETGRIDLPVHRLPVWARSLGFWGDVLLAESPVIWPAELNDGQRALLAAVVAELPGLRSDQAELLAETVKKYAAAMKPTAR